MHDDPPAGADEDFSQTFGRNMRIARGQRGWSQRQLAEALEGQGVRLDPSAVTRIERGDREVKLREAAAIADCLNTDLQQLLMPSGPDRLSAVLAVRGFAEKRMRAGRFAFAELGHYARTMQELLELAPEAMDRLRRLRGRSEELDAHDHVVLELKELLADLHWQKPDFEVADVDERLGDVLQRVVNAAVDNLFVGANSEDVGVDEPRDVNGDDAEA
ncbi:MULTISPECIES: helix-turn-helix domain-containing protein [Mycobacteriaceae]|nr:MULTISPECIES: helix-turn-helix transcriptional regulator [Mycobacteriaceae]MCB0940684.1 helix-turn-helix transcriptional regulator [Mycobacterium sp.]MCV7298041.1 helix-turn-helix transcriptional regulator [Mycobacterium barrassiae]MDM1915750.1 helix-turn-helix transcriptional regulator [Mycobacteroides abscessus]MDM1928167.1 helix-turn-helix transcriptional regulator [Mycobacteroides abscessus]MDM1932505.1 helix-turn-helix transcriptional regulator [Mycobacteroides abscessus]